MSFIKQSVINIDQDYYSKDEQGNQWPILKKVNSKDI